MDELGGPGLRVGIDSTSRVERRDWSWVRRVAGVESADGERSMAGNSKRPARRPGRKPH